MLSVKGSDETENNIINKTMDFEDLTLTESKDIIRELNDLIINLRSKGQKISSWYGSFDLSGTITERINRGYNYKALEGSADDSNFPWFLYWEIIWVVINADFKKGQKVIDLGGSSSLFSFYLASKGLDVTTVDLQPELVENGDKVAKAMGWDLKNHLMKIQDIELDEQFDHITSICVFEHIPMYERVKINEGIKRLLKKGGRFSITFDYRNPSRFAGINSPDDVKEQFVEASGLKVRGNELLFDNKKNYLLHPFYYKNRLWSYKKKAIEERHFGWYEYFRVKNYNDYTFASLFMEKD